MKHLAVLIVISILIISTDCFADTNENQCLSYVKKEGNFSRGHENKNCLDAANTGSMAAQYYVGLGYGAAGNREQSIKFLRLSANRGNTSAYLVLGHEFRKSDPWKAIYWYQRFVGARAEGYQLAAIMISDIFKELGDDAQSMYWLQVCSRAAGKPCSNKQAPDQPKHS